MSVRLGCKPDPHDGRDRPFGALVAKTLASPPPSADLTRPEVLPKDQDQTSSCTGQSTSQGLRLSFLRAGVECPELSALFPYITGRAEDGTDDVDEGSTLRNVLKAVMRFGCADEAAWPFSNERVNVHPGPSAYRSAFDRRGPKGYYRVPTGNPDEVRRALAAGYPVIGGWQVSQAFIDWDGKKPIGAQTTGIVGGHALPIVAYDTDGTFRLLNSWGIGWGRDGYAIVTDAFIAQGTDLWALET